MHMIPWELIALIACVILLQISWKSFSNAVNEIPGDAGVIKKALSAVEDRRASEEHIKIARLGIDLLDTYASRQVLIFFLAAWATQWDIFPTLLAVVGGIWAGVVWVYRTIIYKRSALSEVS